MTSLVRSTGQPAGLGWPAVRGAGACHTADVPQVPGQYPPTYLPTYLT